jgi:hypothetical protein
MNACLSPDSQPPFASQDRRCGIQSTKKYGQTKAAEHQLPRESQTNRVGEFRKRGRTGLRDSYFERQYSGGVLHMINKIIKQ